MQDEHQPFVRRQGIEDDQQGQADRVGEQCLFLRLRLAVRGDDGVGRVGREGFFAAVAFFISRECISVQTLQPLIWLARKWTRLAVVSGTPAFFADALKAIRVFRASGMSTAMLVIRACMFSSEGFPCRCLSHWRGLFRHRDDPRRRKKVTAGEQDWLAERSESTSDLYVICGIEA